MAKKKTKRLFSLNSILGNLIAIGITAVVLVVITLFALNIYTRHGENIVVPDLSGLQADEAEAILESKKLQMVVIDSIYKLDAVPGGIIEQAPKAGNNVKTGRHIYITIYAYSPQKISIPGLTDYSARQAISLLQSIGFNDIEIVEVPHEYSGIVLSVEYKGRPLLADEQIPAGSRLKLNVGVTQDPDDFDDDFNEDYIHYPDRVNQSDASESETGSIDEGFF